MSDLESDFFESDLESEFEDVVDDEDSFEESAPAAGAFFLP